MITTDAIRSLCAKLRSLAVTLDSETARLQRALEREDSNFEGYAMRILHDLDSEVRTLKAFAARIKYWLSMLMYEEEKLSKAGEL